MAITEIQKGQTDWHLPLNENFKALEDMIKGVALAMHPIGSIYMSTTNTNPGTLFGGTWTAWGSGRVPVGVNTADNDFKTVEKIGGEKTHTLTVDEMPRHNHDLSCVNESQEGQNSYNPPWRYNGNWTVQVFSMYTGGDQPHNNLQPYITCYMWKRTA